MNKERHVLVVFPHPDDEAFGVSGTLAMHIANGTPITYACLTLGEMGRNLGNPPFATRESLPKIRKKELLKAAEAIGISDLRMLRFRDKTIEFEDDEKMTQLIESLITELNPSLVISFYPGHSVHPDHEATARAVVRAIQRMHKDDRPNLHCVAFSNNHEQEIGPADIMINIEPFAEQKKNAIRAHLSQTAWMLEEMEPKWKAGDKIAMEWLHTERFWTYRFT
ncbi:bacillithiol biosynthesis deacetylase BshB2 [Halalkalibacter krulwichiae]|uniref:1D-myo-inositol 2-acetamido-2-deoxy-alpha-D-glucopyranoside deacetylase n=1 Tax=Halalkalibacter krulwichiae TaxID=199441 RepID=A0A1X9MBD9_9BACI|nr:bacillithiol biosynthesis deacetylase BshB2 [Halalkalibacter krulwichiae]ARK30718.1 1D-myo-inositol 2-acetamido-2-deoxy-alpha-D-glucopyranoside deacetylase [Halalkalibacter krulwichiae]